MSNGGVSHEGVSIRDGAISDASELVMLSRRCFKKSPEWFVPRFIVSRWWRWVMEHPGCVVRVATDNEGVLGYAISVYKYDDWDQVSHQGAHSKVMKGLVTLLRPSFLKSYLRKRKKARSSGGVDSGGSSMRTEQNVQSEGLKRVSVREVLGDDGVYWGIVAVDPRAQGRGVGKVLLEGVLEFGKCAGADRVCLHVDARNKRAQGLYEKYGYELMGRDGNSYLMMKQLVDGVD